MISDHTARDRPGRHTAKNPHGLNELKFNEEYGSDSGTGDTLWAVFDGALSYTSNPYDANPVFVHHEPLSTIPFEYTGLTDGNWHLTKYMRVDRNTPDQEMAIMYNDNNTEQVVWWSQWGGVDVSARGNLWGWSGPSFVDEIQKLEWSSNTSTDISIGGRGGFGKTAFVYDYYDTPYFLGESRYYVSGTSTSNNTGVMVMSSVKRVHYTPHPRLGGAAMGMVWQNERASGMFQANTSSYNTSAYKTGSTPKFLLSHGQGKDNVTDFLDSLDGFTGRSMIDVTDVFAPGNFGSSADATFAFNLQPNQKDDSTQNGDTTILELSDKQNRLLVRWRHRSNDEFLIAENDIDHFLGATPVNITSGFYRLVITISGTLLKVYIDGVQLYKMPMIGQHHHQIFMHLLVLEYMIGLIY